MAQPSPVIHRPRPASSSEYLKFSLWFIMLTGLGSAGFVLLLWHRQPWGLVLLAVGVAGAVFVAWSARAFHQQAEYAMNPTIMLTEPAPPPVKIVEPVERTSTTTGQEFKYSGINLREDEWPIFAGMMLRLGKITFRDLNNLKLPSFDKLDKKLTSGQTKYAYIVNKLTEMGWVDNSELTEAGRAYFETKVQKRAASPTPPPAQVYALASVHTSDDNKTTTGKR